jgi:hypothetical protein
MATYIECECHSDEHTIKFERTDECLLEDGETEVTISVQLCKRLGFFSRCWAATKYVFGYECKFGHWDCVCLGSFEQGQLYGLLKPDFRPGPQEIIKDLLEMSRTSLDWLLDNQQAVLEMIADADYCWTRLPAGHFDIATIRNLICTLDQRMSDQE